MRNMFIIADTHFGHPGVIMHCQRSVLREGDIVDGYWVNDEIKAARTKEMDEITIENWNNKVTRKDTTIIGGDLAWLNHRKYIQALNGKKILVKGNHDKMSQMAYDDFQEVTQIKDLKIDKKLVIICHYPMYSWRNSCHGSWHIHGHTHNSPFKHPGLALNAGIDLTDDFAPMEWETQVKPYFEEREALLLVRRNEDHHGVNPAQEVKNLLGDMLDEFRKPEISLQRERIQEMYDKLKLH